MNPLAADLLAALTQNTAWAAYQADPVGFFRTVLGLEPWSRQREVLEAVLHHPRIAVRSGHKVGKTALAAGLALWWVATKPRSRVILTSASYRQVRSILWREIRALHAGAHPPLGGELHLDPEAGLQFPDGREVMGLSTLEPERMSGISGANLLFVLDEAAGIPVEIFEAIEGNRAGGAKLLLLGNPTRTSGTFFDAFNGKREFWHPLHISAEESPNVTEGRTVIPGLATREWVEEKRREWSETSPLYQVRVRGDFPSQSENAIIALALVEDATARWSETPEDGRLTLGVDVARFGDDDSVIFPVRGRKALVSIAFGGQDTVNVAGRVLEVARTLRMPGETPLVRIDVIGVGAGVYDHLSRATDIEAAPVNAANAATVDGYALIRDQLWFELRNWLKDGGAIPPDSRLEAELVAPTYAFDTQGRAKVEPKEKMKARLGHSPDRADALALAVGTVGQEVHVWGGNSGQGTADSSRRDALGRPVPEWVW